MKKKLETVLWILVACGSLLRFLTPFVHHPLDALWSDPGRHWSHATDPLSYNPMGAFDPIMYQVWLGIVANVTFGNPLVVAVYAGLLSVITPWVWYLFFRELFPRKIFALWGLLFLTYLPSWVGIYSYFMNETLLLPLLGLALYYTQLTLRSGSLGNFSKTATLWLCASLTKAIGLPLGVIALSFLLLKGEQRLRKLALLSLLSFVFLLPPAFRAYNIMGVWAPFGYAKPHQIYMRSGKLVADFQVLKSPSHVHAWGLAMASCYKNPFAPFFEWQQLREGHLKMLVDADHGDEAWQTALRNTTAPLPRLMKLWGENVVFFFFAQPWPDGDPKHFWENLNVQTRWIWAPLFALVIAGNILWLLRRRKLPLFVVLNLCGWLVCIFSLDVGESRYHKPLEGLLLANALWLYQLYLSSNKLKKTKKFALGKMQSSAERLSEAKV